MKTKRNEPDADPITVTEGSVSVKIYRQTNRVFLHQKDPQTGRLLPVRDPVTGNKITESEHPQFELVYWSGSRRVKQKFHDLFKAEAEARLAVTKLANG